MSVNTGELGNADDLSAFATDFTTEFVTEFRAGLYQELNQQAHTYVSWMFGLLAGFTALVWAMLVLFVILAR